MGSIGGSAGGGPAHLVAEPLADRVCRVEQVAHHRAGSRPPAGALAPEEDVADQVARDLNGVEGPLDGGERVVYRDHRRVDPGFDPAAGARCESEQLDLVAKL